MVGMIKNPSRQVRGYDKELRNIGWIRESESPSLTVCDY